MLEASSFTCVGLARLPRSHSSHCARCGCAGLEDSCNAMDDEQRGRLAFRLTRCHMESLGETLGDCTAPALVDCTSTLSERAVTAFTVFMPAVQQVRVPGSTSRRLCIGQDHSSRASQIQSAAADLLSCRARTLHREIGESCKCPRPRDGDERAGGMPPRPSSACRDDLILLFWWRATGRVPIEPAGRLRQVTSQMERLGEQSDGLLRGLSDAVDAQQRSLLLRARC